MGKTCVKEAETGLAAIPRAPGKGGPPLNSSNLQSHPSYDSSRLSCLRITNAVEYFLCLASLPEFSFNFAKLYKVNTVTLSLDSDMSNTSPKEANLSKATERRTQMYVNYSQPVPSDCTQRQDSGNLKCE